MVMVMEENTDMERGMDMDMTVIQKQMNKSNKNNILFKISTK